MSSNRHTILSYALLFAILFFIWLFTLQPSHKNWQVQKAASFALKQQLADAESQLKAARRDNNALRSSLVSLLHSEILGRADSSSAAGHQLQARLKPILEANSVSVLQLRPSNELLPSGLSKSRLELSFRVPSDLLQPLLNALDEHRPHLNIDLISLANNHFEASGLNNKVDNSKLRHGNLDGSLNLELWYIDDSSVEKGAILAEKSLASSEFQSRQNDEILTDKSVGIGAVQLNRARSHNTLAGIFDLNARLRLNFPDRKHYRLAAVNISNNARFAIIVNTHDGKIRRLQQGDSLDAWQVESIARERVNQTKGGPKKVLYLPR
jgi:hypothetical protein